MKLLPKSKWTLEVKESQLIAGIFESPDGVRMYDVYNLADLPNDFLSNDDLESFGINLIETFAR